MDDLTFLRHAVHVASHSEEPVQCGVILVDKTDKMIAQAYNSQRADNQAINHAEIKAIQQANEGLGSRVFEGVTAYCSCEPCAMCLVALALAKVERVVFGQSMREAAPDDPLAQLEAQDFVDQYLGGIPKLEQLVIS
jgi:tRNA(adenine34) deaminase